MRTRWGWRRQDTWGGRAGGNFFFFACQRFAIENWIFWSLGRKWPKTLSRPRRICRQNDCVCACVLPVFACILPLFSLRFACALHTFSLRFPCVLHAFCMCFTCILRAFCLCFAYVLPAFLPAFALCAVPAFWRACACYCACVPEAVRWTCGRGGWSEVRVCRRAGGRYEGGAWLHPVEKSVGRVERKVHAAQRRPRHWWSRANGEVAGRLPVRGSLSFRELETG